MLTINDLGLPSLKVFENGLYLLKHLQAFEKFLNHHLIINDGYRSPEHNRLVDGAADSQHLFGEAADFWCVSMPTDILFSLLISAYQSKLIEVDQAILEHKGHDIGWIHYSVIDGLNRNEFLTATWNDVTNKMEYKKHDISKSS